MDDAAAAMPVGSLPARIAAGIVFATSVLYVGLILSQGEGDALAVVIITAYLLGLATLALAGGLRRRPDRVIALGAATGGLVGASVWSLFSIGAFLFVAGIFALVAWMRAGVGASRRQQLLAGIAAVAAALGFSLCVLLV